MKIFRVLSILVLALAAGAAHAQDKATVSGVVIDPHGTLYASGTISAVLYPPGGPSPTVNNLPINGATGNYPMGDAISSPGGSFSMSIYRNDVIVPAGTRWVFTVCNPGALPPVGFSNICFSSPPINITGDVDISAILNAVAPILLNLFGGGGGFGTVTSVGLSGPGGIFGITGSPVTTVGVLGFNVTGVSGGAPCFTATNIISASVLWDTNLLVKGGGVGACASPSTILDDGTNSPRSPHGLNVASSGISAELQNGNPGTVLHRLVCLDGGGLATVCGDNVTSGIQGVAKSGAGDAGTVEICKLISCEVEFDNQSVARDYSVAGTGGRLHDTGAATVTANNENFFNLTANAGADTDSNVAPPGDIVGGASSSGTCVNPMVLPGDWITGGALGACARLGGASTLTGVVQFVTSSWNGSAAVSAVTPGGVGPRAVTGATASDTVLVTDRGFRVDYQTSVSVAVGIGTPASLGGSGFPVKLVNDTSGVNTFVNVTAGGGSTIKNGNKTPSATLAIPQNTACTFYVDAVITQWDTDCQPVSANSNYRTCMLGPLGANNGAILVNADLGPQSFGCSMDSAATIVEIDIQAINATGTPSIIAGRNHNGSITNLVSSALATAATGGRACAKTTATLGIDGVTTCSATLQNTAITQGDWLQLVSGTADGAATLLSIAVTFLRN